MTEYNEHNVQFRHGNRFSGDDGITFPTTQTKNKRPDTIAGIFQHLSTLSTDEEKVSYLREMRHQALLIVLRILVDDCVEWLVSSKPPKSRNDEPPVSLYMAAGRLYLFLDDFVLWRPNPVKNDARKRQKLWDSWGESLYRSEAVFVSEYLLIKKLPPCLSREIVFRAFPELQFPMHVDERRDRTKIVESNAGVVVRETDAEIQKMQSEIESAEQNLNILYFRLRELKERRRAVLSQREAGLR